jgi:hypothetical protein
MSHENEIRYAKNADFQYYLTLPLIGSTRAMRVLRDKGVLDLAQLKYWVNLGIVREVNPEREHQRRRKIYTQDEFRKIYYMGVLVNFLGFVPRYAATVAEKLVKAPEHNGLLWVEYKAGDVKVQMGITPLEDING